MQTTLAVVEALVEDGWEISPQHIGAGLAQIKSNAGLRGRMECLSQTPKVICDVGHNESGVQHIIHQLSQFPARTLHFVWGMVSDKDHHAILDLLPRESSYYWVRPSIPRALDHETLQQKADDFHLSGTAFASVRDGVEAALAAAKPDEVIFIGGSTFVVADALGLFPEKEGKKPEVRMGS